MGAAKEMNSVGRSSGVDMVWLWSALVYCSVGSTLAGRSEPKPVTARSVMVKFRSRKSRCRRRVTLFIRAFQWCDTIDVIGIRRFSATVDNGAHCRRLEALTSVATGPSSHPSALLSSRLDPVKKSPL